MSRWSLVATARTPLRCSRFSASISAASGPRFPEPGVSAMRAAACSFGCPSITESPSPISPWPTLAWRSRCEPNGSSESLTCRQRSRSRPIRSSTSSSNPSTPSRLVMSMPDANRWQVSRQRPTRGGRPSSSMIERQLLDGDADHALVAGAVFEQQPGPVVVALSEHDLQRRARSGAWPPRGRGRGGCRRGRRRHRRRSRCPHRRWATAPSPICRRRHRRWRPRLIR